MKLTFLRYKGFERPVIINSDVKTIHFSGKSPTYLARQGGN